MTVSGAMSASDVHLSLKARSLARRGRRSLRRLLVAKDPRTDDREVWTHVATKVVLVLFCVTYIVTLSRWSLRNHWAFLTYGFDLGIFDQGVWLLSRFREPFVTVRGLNLFGDHTSFILLFVAPLYRVFDSAAVLLVAQSAALGAGAVGVFLIAREKLRNEIMSVAFAAVYLLHPAVQWTNLENFHPDTFATPLALFAFFFMIKERWRAFLVTVIVLLLVKEDVALLTVPLGIYVALVHDRRVGLVTAAVSAAWLFVALRVVIPGFNDTGALYESRLAFGGIGETLKAIFTQPLEVIRLVLSENRPWFLLQLFAPLAALSLLGWRVCLLGIGALGVNLLSAFPYQHQIEYHYTTLIVPVLVVAAIFGISRVWSTRGRVWLSCVVVVATMVSVYLWGPALFSRHPGPLGDPASDYARDAREAVARIPDDASVSAVPTLVPHLSHRAEIYEFPNPFEAANWGDASREGTRLPLADSVDFVVVQVSPGDSTTQLMELIGADFEIDLSNDNLMVLERVR
jgi:uncharacterized membrane protein